MIDDDLSNLIRERQRRAECEAAGVVYVPDVLAARSAPHCDPATPAVPDVLLEPNAAPTVPVPDRVLPSPLLIRSPQVIVLCADHGGGSGSAVAPYGESSIDLYLDDIPTLTRSELYLITDNQAQLQEALDDNLEPLVAGAITASAFDAAVMSAAGVEAAAAAGIRLKALELRGSGGGLGEATGLYAIAELTAMSRLVCNFFSQPLWAVCDSESTTGFALLLAEPAPLPPVDRYRYRPAAFRSSTTSVEDANEQAALDAVSDPSFECVYVSEALTVTCAVDVDPVFNHTYVDGFFYDETFFAELQDLGATRRWDGAVDSPITSGFTSYALDSLSSLRRLVTVVNVDAGLYPSASQADANDRAREAGIRLLNCFFPSPTAVIDCANRNLNPLTNPVVARMNDLGVTNPGLTFDELRDLAFAEMDSEFATNPLLVTNLGLIPKSPGPGADLDASEGLRVQIPAGMVSSVESAAAAEEEAHNHALGFLSCFWVSPAVTCSCVAEDQVSPVTGSYFYTKAQLDALLAEYSTSVSSGALTFAKGDLGSSEDGFIPVSDTMELCKASLVCVYCNQTVPPRCSVAYSGGVAYDLWSSKTDLGLPLALTSTEGTSSGISAGLPSGIICDADPALVNTLAISTGSLPPLVNEAQGTPRCRYGSSEISKTCAQKVGADAYALTPESATRSITVSAGSFEAETQIEADALAAAFINAALICEYGNPPMTVLCGATSAVDTISSQEYGVPRTYGTGLNVSLDATGGVATPLFVGAHAFTSLESPLNAKAQALLSMVTQLDCFWQSAQIDLACGAAPQLPTAMQEQGEAGTVTAGDLSKNYADDSNGSAYGEVTLARKSVTSYASQQEANRSAYDIAFAELDCFWQSARIDLMCGAPATCPVASLSARETATIQSGSNARDCCPDSTGDTLGEVFMLAKAATSYISQADANQQAYALTYPQLDCFWQSATIDLMCEAPAIYTDSTPETGRIVKGRSQGGVGTKKFCPDSTGSQAGEVVTAAKAVTSYISQADANLQAYAITAPQLDCFWQSARVELRCHAPTACPSDQRDKQENATIQAGTNEKKCCPDSTGDKAGEVFTEAKAVTSYTSQADANTQAYMLTYPQLDCFWQSAKIDLMCGAPLGLPSESADTSEVGTITAGDNTLKPPQEPFGVSRFCPDSVGSQLGEATLAAKAITSYINQADANTQAYLLTYPQLDCFFQSPRILVWCTPVVYLPDYIKSSSNETFTVWSGSGAEKNSVTLEAKKEISYRSQAEATVSAYEAAKKELNCISSKHAFSLVSRPSGGAYSKCCTKLDPDVIKADGTATKLYSPDPDADPLSAHPGYTALPLTGEDVEACDEYPVWFYLEAPVDFNEGDLWAQYRASTSSIQKYGSEQNLVEGEEGAYTLVRRLIAKVEQENSTSSFGAAERATCGGINFMQLVTTEQKISTSQMGDKHVPVITDFDTPEGGGGGGGGACGNLSLSKKADGGTMHLERSAGQVGDEMLEAERVGTLASKLDHFMLAKFTLTGGEVSSEVVFQSSLPSSTDSVKYVLLASIGPEGQLSRQACYASASACRNWFTSSEPLYSMNTTSS